MKDKGYVFLTGVATLKDNVLGATSHITFADNQSEALGIVYKALREEYPVDEGWQYVVGMPLQLEDAGDRLIEMVREGIRAEMGFWERWTGR